MTKAIYAVGASLALTLAACAKQPGQTAQTDKETSSSQVNSAESKVVVAQPNVALPQQPARVPSGLVGKYAVTADIHPFPSNATSAIVFTGPGYCREITGDPHGMTDYLDGTCTMVNGGMEFAAAGQVHFYTFGNGSLIKDGIELVRVR